MKYCDEWYGLKMDRPSRQRTRVIASARKAEPAASNGLLGLLATNDIPYWRGVAAQVRPRRAAELQVAAALLVGLGGANALVRALSALTRWNHLLATPSRVVEALSRSLEDSSRSVRVTAAWAFVRASIFTRKQGPSYSTPSSLMLETSREAKRSWAPLPWHEGMETGCAALRESSEWDPNSAGIRHDYAVVYSGLGRTQEAVNNCKLRVVSNRATPSSNTSWHLAGASSARPTRRSKAFSHAGIDQAHVGAW